MFFFVTQDVMIIIIDAYNVLKQHDSHFVSQEQRAAYIRRMRDYCQCKRHTAWVIFDGGPYLYPVQHAEGNVHVVYTGDYETADSYIQRLLYHQPVDNTLIITSDNELVYAAYHLGIVSMDPSVFDYYVNVALEPTRAGYDTGSGQAQKRTGHESSAYVDRLMERASQYVIYKDEDFRDAVREEVPTSRTPSRQEKMLQRIIRKL